MTMFQLGPKTLPAAAPTEVNIIPRSTFMNTIPKTNPEESIIDLPLVQPRYAGKDEGQRGRRENVSFRDRLVHGDTSRALPRGDVACPLYERHRSARGVARGGNREGPEPTRGQVLIDAIPSHETGKGLPEGLRVQD